MKPIKKMKKWKIFRFVASTLAVTSITVLSLNGDKSFPPDSPALSNKPYLSNAKASEFMNYTQIVATNETAAKFAYCVTAHDEGYMKGALVALVSVGCTDVSDRFEFCIIYVGDTPAPHLLQTAASLNIHVYLMESISPASVHEEYKQSFAKLRAWQLTQYRKVILLDADMICHGPVHELFEAPELSAPACPHSAMVHSSPHLSSAVLVLEPSNHTFKSLVRKLDGYSAQGKQIADMDFLHNVYGPTYNRLEPKYLVITWYLDYPHMPTEELLSFAKCLHYSGMKPWKYPESRTVEWVTKADPTLRRSRSAYASWWTIHDEIFGPDNFT